MTWLCGTTAALRTAQRTTTMQQELATACAQWVKSRTLTLSPGQDGMRWRRVLERGSEIVETHEVA
jgi:hypothetical protein